MPSHVCAVIHSSMYMYMCGSELIKIITLLIPRPVPSFSMLQCTPAFQSCNIENLGMSLGGGGGGRQSLMMKTTKKCLSFEFWWKSWLKSQALVFHVWEHVYLFPLTQTDKIPCFLSSKLCKSHHRYVQHAALLLLSGFFLEIFWRGGRSIDRHTLDLTNYVPRARS